MIFLNNDHRIRLADLRDDDNVSVTDATVAFSLVAPDGEFLVADQAMPHVGDGTYRSELLATVPIVAGRVYRLIVQATLPLRDEPSLWIEEQVVGAVRRP